MLNVLLEYTGGDVPRRKKGPVSLYEVRMHFNLTKDGLVKAVEDVTGQTISRRTIYNCEEGKPIKEFTAYLILNTINAMYRRRGEPERTIDDLTWNVFDRRLGTKDQELRE